MNDMQLNWETNNTLSIYSVGGLRLDSGPGHCTLTNINSHL